MNNSFPRIFQIAAGIAAICLFLFVFVPAQGQEPPHQPRVPNEVAGPAGVGDLSWEVIPETADAQPLAFSAELLQGAAEGDPDLAPSDVPAAPALVSPADTSNVPGPNISLQWNLVGGATDYQVQIALDSGFTLLVFDQALGGVFNILDLMNLPDNGQTYWWRVRAMNGMGWSDWSAEWSVTNGPSAIPEMVVLTSPADTSNEPGLDVSFTWQAAARASEYHFQLALDNSFTNLLVDATFSAGLGITVFDLPDLGQTFWWRMQAANSLGSGPWSTPFSFVNGPSSPAQISGTVTDGVNPIPGAVVEVDYKATTTDALGQYTLANLHSGEQIILASKSGYDFDFTIQDIGDGANINGVDFVLGSDGTNPLIQPSPSTVNFALPETPLLTSANPLPARAGGPRSTAATPAASPDGVVPNQYIVRLKPGRSTADLQAMSAVIEEEYKGEVIKDRATPRLINSFVFDPYIVVELPEGQEPSLDDFANLAVESIEPRHYYRTLAPATNDPLYGTQWGWPRIQMPLAWAMGPGTATTKVAIIDGGVDYTHPDLAPSFGTLKGHDFVDNDTDPAPNFIFTNHGTHVTGILGSAINNSVGVAGIGAFDLLSVRTMNEFGSGMSDDIADGINWATSQGVQVINMSIGGPFDSLIASAVSNAYANNVLMIAAAGNDGVEGLDFPAGYAAVMAVGSLGISDARSSFSNYGPGLDITAPGSVIMSTLQDNDYGFLSGTSMASPHVAGVAALVLNHAPALTHDQVRSILTMTADDLGDPGWDGDYGYGRVNAYRAVLAALQQSLDGRIVSLQNMGDAVLNVSDISSSESWLTFSPTSFEIGPNGAQDVYLFADPSGQIPGNFADTLNITHNAAGSPQNVAVNMQVIAGLQNQQIALDSGWNTISSYLDPTLTAMDDIFIQPERSSLLLCKNDSGQVYWPSLSINDIGSWDAEKGYQCYSTKTINAVTAGLPFPPAQGIPLDSSWSTVAFWRDTAVPADQAFNSLGNDLFLAKNSDGQIYWPDFGINQIGSLQPGQGYQLYMEAPGTLVYP